MDQDGGISGDTGRRQFIVISALIATCPVYSRSIDATQRRCCKIHVIDIGFHIRLFIPTSPVPPRCFKFVCQCSGFLRRRITPRQLYRWQFQTQVHITTAICARFGKSIVMHLYAYDATAAELLGGVSTSWLPADERLNGKSSAYVTLWMATEICGQPANEEDH